MGYRTIIVHIDCGKRRAERLRLSAAIAEAFDAHLVGVFAVDIMRIPAYALPETAPIVMDTEAKRRAEAASEAEHEFRDVAGRRASKAEWRAFTGDPVAAVALNARCADLVVIGQFDPNSYETDCVPPYFTEDLVLSAGKPVLIVPYAGHFAQVGERPMVAWNGAREASRAVWDALPMLKRSEKVEVVSFESGKSALPTDEVAREDMARYLERHAVKAKVSRTVLGELNAGDAILSRAADLGADSIVMGAYGHSRVRERVLGGATRTVLDHMTVPVLMSH